MLFTALAGFGLLPAVFAANVQKAGLVLPDSAAQNRQAVKDMFQTSYEGYRQVAFGHDDAKPISKGFNDDRNGWGATIIDALTTAKIMGFDDFFNEGVEFAAHIDFSKSQTPDTVSVFETTIRYLGSLLSAYQMSNNNTLLTKAVEVADKMAFAWVGNNDVPFGHITFATNTPATDSTSNIAEAGTLILEWSTLSNLTGNATYGQLAEKSMRRIATNPAPLPGLPGQGIDPATGQPVGALVTWNGGSDSYFEYLIKHARLSNTDDPLFVNSWLTAVDSSLQFLQRRTTVGNHLHFADLDDDKKIRHVGSHLECFNGGNLLLGGKLTNNDTIVNAGLELVDACWNTYASTATGIGPDAFSYESSDGTFTGGPDPNAEQQAFYAQHGFYITSGAYFLRPEVLESNFYAWRVTGDTKYLDNAAAAIQSFNAHLNATAGYAELNDVNDVNSSQIDAEESFWFAEVLKYLFLTFDDPSHISLDDYVFNTEAHPFRAPPAKDTYGALFQAAQSSSASASTGTATSLGATVQSATSKESFGTSILKAPLLPFKVLAGALPWIPVLL
ncbi:glycoside hydrolase family 47 protein [Mycena floridula]|nr:glycoside hydrolase family 47 protein [Mycena floridula]